jgi:hypothetical protein
MSHWSWPERARAIASVQNQFHKNIRAFVRRGLGWYALESDRRIEPLRCIKRVVGFQIQSARVVRTRPLNGRIHQCAANASSLVAFVGRHLCDLEFAVAHFQQGDASNRDFVDCSDKDLSALADDLRLRILECLQVFRFYSEILSDPSDIQATKIRFVACVERSD